ncbi:MAG: 16S rRNA (guanine(966)-N(2))-methyltransferase RsmD [Leptolyngbyaceae cyanobacterium bins.59]|nr:16S rRNA (guanine(966)-N(2))-methyltransferase RsmD [Leptolyngbyaceae cyanobacterium bins.59]
MSLRISGNRALKTLPGQATRPTPGRVREAVFNIWQGTIAGCRWLDLCAGSGAMGAEALCRKATLVVGIEQSSQACRVIRQNWEAVAQAPEQFRLVQGDVLKRLPGLQGQQFDRIYFDPPYASNLYQPVLTMVAEYHLLSLEGEIAVEHRSEGWNMEPIAGLAICREKNYGGTALTFYCPINAPEESLENGQPKGEGSTEL